MKARLRKGFTLIELLVVITIIAILAAFAVPAVTGVILRAHMMKGVNNSRQIMQAVRTYAADHDGNFPDPNNADMIAETTGITNRAAATSGAKSTNAWQMLIALGVMPSEAIFYIAQDRAKDSTRLVAPDENFSTALEEKNNAWGYTTGLDDTMPGGIPCVYTQYDTGSTSSIKWVAAGNKTKAGGCWDGKVVIAHVDGSTTPETLDSGGLVQKGSPKVDVTDLTKYLGTTIPTTIQVLAP